MIFQERIVAIEHSEPKLKLIYSLRVEPILFPFKPKMLKYESLSRISFSAAILRIPRNSAGNNNSKHIRA